MPAFGMDIMYHKINFFWGISLCGIKPISHPAKNTHREFLLHKLLKHFLWKSFKLSKHDTEVFCFMGLSIKHTWSYRNLYLQSKRAVRFHRLNWTGHVCQLRACPGGYPIAEGTHLGKQRFPPALTKGSSTMAINVLSAWAATSQVANSRENQSRVFL